MRRILVDYARRRNAARREGAGSNIQLKEALVMAIAAHMELQEVDDARKDLTQLP